MQIDDRKFQEAVGRIIDRDPRYTVDAYDFISKAVSFTARRLKRGSKVGGTRHVNCRELVSGVCEYALKQYGPLADTVMREWGLSNPRSIGEVVFNMIDENLLRKSDEERVEDFDLVDFDFDGIFQQSLPKIGGFGAKPPKIDS